MKQVAYIVKINVPLDDAYTIQDTQRQLTDAVQRAGLSVASIAPWSRSSLQTGTSLFSGPEPAGGIGLPDIELPSI